MGIRNEYVKWSKKEKIRELAKQKILYYYGGLFVPPSLLCLKSLRSLYVFSDEMAFKVHCDKYESIYGSKKYSKNVEQYITKLAYSVDDNSTELEFNDMMHDNDQQFFMEIDNQLIGKKDNNGGPIDLDVLLGESKVHFPENILKYTYHEFKYKTVSNTDGSKVNQ